MNCSCKSLWDHSNFITRCFVLHVMVDFIRGATSLSESSPMLLEHGASLLRQTSPRNLAARFCTPRFCR